MQQHNGVQSTTPTNVEKTHKDNSLLISNEPYEKMDVIRIMGNDNIGYKAVIGMYSVTKVYQNKRELIQMLDNAQTELIFRIVATMIEIKEKIGKENNNSL